MFFLFPPPRWLNWGSSIEDIGWHGLPLGEPPFECSEGNTYWYLGLFWEGDGDALLPLKGIH